MLYEENADQALPPASVTKIMTLLLVMEAIDGGSITLNDTVQVSENAASMGGSQVFLKPGETMSVEELLKCVIVASANDASVALAEFVAGSEEAFVARMNERAGQLGMQNTHFENTNGLDDTTTEHLTSARDIAIMSAELIRHPKILDYSSIWMDSIRNGSFGLTNTNRLIRFYRGANGLKTGSTSRAGFCISASALRDGMQLIAVVMGSPTRDLRNETAKKLLDYGFANYCYVRFDSQVCGQIPVPGGTAETCSAVCDGFEAVLPKSAQSKVERRVTLPESLTAPVEAGSEIGKVVYEVDGKPVGDGVIRAGESVDRVSFWTVLARMLGGFLLIDG